ncbi:HlyD family efflux transporter periplasmic adaptor subunit [Oscillospiraceae bacterium MB08-C2-2]|nr:HlyD family efflux transporter periplasmic adaptor subunit [Oscillospiraceae bacterium MB08-C2-2]
MKKRVFIWVLTLLIIAGFAAVPGMVQSSVPSVYYTSPQIKSYENSISCTGVVQSAQVQEVYLQSVLIPEEVLVSVGDTVRENELLVRVDTQLTQGLKNKGYDFLDSLTMQGLPEGIPASLPQLSGSAQGEEWLELASAYGLTAAISQYSGNADLSALGALLGDSQMVSSSFDTPISESVPYMVTEEAVQEIRAPISGIITALNIKRQAPASTGVPVITIADSENFNVMATVSEADIGEVTVGDRARISGTAFPNQVFNGTISKIYPTARKALRGTTSETVVDVEIALDQGSPSLKSGFTAKVEILGDESQDVLTLPYEAIRQDESNNEFVYVYTGGTLKKRVVLTGREMLNEVEILEGVSPSDVIAYNPEKLLEKSNYVGLRGRADAS